MKTLTAISQYLNNECCVDMPVAWPEKKKEKEKM